MSATLLHRNNTHDELLQTPLGKRIMKKYRVVPFHKTYRPVYQISKIGSYACNFFSIVTASTYIFSFTYDILASLPYAAVWSSVVSLIILVGIETLLRFFAPLFFRNTLLYRSVFRSWGVALCIAFLCSLSVSFSYFGGFDLVKTVVSKPQQDEPVLEDVATIEARYTYLIQDAANDAEEFRKSKIYLGRLSDRNATIYKGLLDNKDQLRREMTEAIHDARKRNENLLEEAERVHKQAMENYERSTKSKSGSLGHFSICIQILFLIAVWFMELYDYKTAQHFRLFPETGNRKGILSVFRKQSETVETESHENSRQPPLRETENTNSRRNGKQLQTAGKQSTVTETTYTNSPPLQTVFHNGKHYGLREVNNFVRIYKNRYLEAIKENKETLAHSRKKRFDYWKEQRDYLLGRLG